MSRSRRPLFASLFTAALAPIIVSACGPGIVSPDKHNGPPVAVLTANVEGALQGDLPADAVRAALLWSAYDPALLACLNEVPAFDVPLDPYNNPADEEVVYELSLCLTLHLTSTIESDSVALEPTFPSSFEIPLFSLPGPSLLTGEEGARFGLAAVDIYVDGNSNDKLDLVEPGTFASADTVIGSSAAVSEDDVRHSLVVFREGDLSPLWTLFRAIYDCPESVPEGFSVVNIETSEDFTSISCVVTEGPIAVRLSDSAEMRHEVCLPQPQQGEFVEAIDDATIPGGASIACEDGVAYYSTSADAVCPLIGHFDLIGCRDTSSENACRATFFDHQEAPPSWWPCSSFGQSVYFLPTEVRATSGLDVLGTINVQGSSMFQLADLSVVVETQDGTVTLTVDAFTLTDEDGNGWANAGDHIVVREVSDVFNTSTPAGVYSVEVLIDGEPASLSSYVPVDLLTTELPRHSLEVLDAPGNGGEDGDLLFTVTSLSGEGTYALDEMHLVVLLFGKAFEEMPNDMLTLIDADDDNRFGAGDTIEVRMSPNVSEWARAQLHDQNNNFVQLEVETAVNVFTSITGGDYGSATWGRFTVRIDALAAPLTDGLDDIATLTVVNADPFALAGIGGSWSVGLGGDQLVQVNIDATYLAHDDVDGDGLVSRGDVLTLHEVTPLLSSQHSNPDVYQSVYLAAPDGSNANAYNSIR